MGRVAAAPTVPAFVPAPLPPVPPLPVKLPPAPPPVLLAGVPATQIVVFASAPAPVSGAPTARARWLLASIKPPPPLVVIESLAIRTSGLGPTARSVALIVILVATTTQ